MNEDNKKLTLQEIININNALTILSNNGVGFKDVKVSFSLALLKSDIVSIVDTFVKVTNNDSEADTKSLLKTTHSIKVPEIILSIFETCSGDVPLIVFELLSKYITK